jgi:ribosomal protein L12E/L44/L45/RPP1/RPP2
MQIYWGAVPFVIIQIVMVGLIIAYPGIVTSGLDKVEKFDLDKVQLQMNQEAQDAAAAPASGPAAVVPEGTPNPADEQKSQDEEQKKIDELFKK